MDKNKRKSLVSFNEETFEMLRAYAFISKKSIKSVIEKAVDQFIENNDIKKLASMVVKKGDE